MSEDGQFESTPEELKAFDDRIGEILSLSESDRRTELADMGLALQADLAEVSGLADELGGTDAAAAAMQQAWLPTIEGTLELETEPIQLGFARSAAPAALDGEGLFGGNMAIQLVLNEATEQTTNNPGGDLEEKAGQRTRNPRADVKATVEKVSATITGEQTAQGVTTKLSAKLDVVACPAADGTFTAKANLDVAVSKGASSQRTTIDVTVNGTVSESAELEAIDMGFRVQAGRSSGGKGEFIDLSGTAQIGESATGVVVRRSGGSANAALRSEVVDIGSLYGLLLGMELYQTISAAWKSGRCVQLNATASPGPSGLRPSSSATISASPRSKVDGTPTGGSVTATLSAGGAGVDPSATKVPADAKFTYTAPDKSGEGGTVELESRSRRGIGKATVVLTTGGIYAASGGGGVTFSGTVADLEAPFELSAQGVGFTVTFSFVPTDATSGSLSYAGGGGGASLMGQGSYTITGDDPDHLEMTVVTGGCANPGTCKDNTDVVTLTRITE